MPGLESINNNYISINSTFIFLFSLLRNDQIVSTWILLLSTEIWKVHLPVIYSWSELIWLNKKSIWWSLMILPWRYPLLMFPPEYSAHKILPFWKKLKIVFWSITASSSDFVDLNLILFRSGFIVFGFKYQTVEEID